MALVLHRNHGHSLNWHVFYPESRTNQPIFSKVPTHHSPFSCSCKYHSIMSLSPSFTGYRLKVHLLSLLAQQHADIFHSPAHPKDMMNHSILSMDKSVLAQIVLKTARVFLFNSKAQEKETLLFITSCKNIHNLA